MAAENFSTSQFIREMVKGTINRAFNRTAFDFSSQVSLEFDGDDPPKIEFEVIRKRGVNKLQFVVNKMYPKPLEEISLLDNDDRVLMRAGQFLPSENTMLVYKALTKAIDRGKIQFVGTYNCVTKSIPGDPQRAAKVKADKLVPYIYSSSSNIRGTVEFRRTSNEDNETREVIIINVTGQGDRPDIPDGTLVFLGGKNHVVESDFKLEPYQQGWLYISCPFPNVWKLDISDDGPNVLIAELEDGNYAYWSTQRGVELDKNVMQLGSEVFAALEESYRGDEEEDEFVFKVKNAWVLRGNCLRQNTTLDIPVPSKVSDILHCGFFYTTAGFTHRGSLNLFLSFERRLRRLLDQVGKLGAHMFGLVQRDDGIYGDITTLSTSLGLRVDPLLNQISTRMGMEKYFGGSVEFLFPVEEEEREEAIDVRKKFIITGPVPFSKWASGRVMDTGVGLLYVKLTATYYDVKELDGVGLLSVYKGPPRTKRMEVNVESIMLKR